MAWDSNKIAQGRGASEGVVKGAGGAFGGGAGGNTFSAPDPSAGQPSGPEPEPAPAPNMASSSAGNVAGAFNQPQGQGAGQGQGATQGSGGLFDLQSAIKRFRESLQGGMSSEQAMDPLMTAIHQYSMNRQQQAMAGVGAGGHPGAQGWAGIGMFGAGAHHAGQHREQAPTHSGGADGGARDWIIQHESGGDVNSRNPSGAFGLGQLMPGNRKQYASQLGISNPDTTDRGQQQAMMDAYVKDRYGSYDKALAFWKSHNWY